MTDDASQAEADLRSRIVEALDYEEDDGRPFPDLVAALIAEVHAADARTIATRQMSIDADATTRAQLLAALGREDDGRTTRTEYVAALAAERAAAQERVVHLEVDRVETWAEYDRIRAERDALRSALALVVPQRDEARSALERIRALHRHQKARNPFGVEYDECVACGWIDTGKCPTIAALDGEPAEEQR